VTLAAGTRLGPYEILSAIGAGGMGEVYRARDPRLDRDVAIKILPEAFASDAERVARFQREARVLASLNHPNIAIVHGLEPAEGSHALVMELVDGEDLAQRLERGVIPLDEALPIARQIARALEAAHEQGIIHRDLKPANIKVRLDGTVKVLDFGLAKALAFQESATAFANSPTITSLDKMTSVGAVLGTAAYMSPEQARGQPADKRADVWAFGCVLYEMLTGRRASDSEDEALPSQVPPAVRSLIRGCLRKDRKERIGDISTALFVLEQPRMMESTAVSRAPRSMWRRVMPVVAAAIVGAAVTAAVIWKRPPSLPTQVSRFTLPLPPGQVLTFNRRAVAISPDGTQIAYAAGGIFLRPMAEFEGKAIPGTNPGLSPVFSPDGQSLAFYADLAIRRIAITGGVAVPLCPVEVTPPSLSWTDDRILFTDQRTAIMSVSSKGGKPEVLLDVADFADQVYGPQLLPDGDTLLFSTAKLASAAADGLDAGHIEVYSLKTHGRKLLIDGGADARYVPTGHIVYASEGALFAVPFDLPTLAVTGGQVPVIDSVRLGGGVGAGRAAHFAFSNTGSLAYVPGPTSVSAGQQLLLIDRGGQAEVLKLPPGRVEFPRVSPDGKRIAFGTTDGKEAVVSIYELSGASPGQRLTYGGNNRFPIWSGDGNHVAFQSDRDRDVAVFRQPVNGGPAERLTTPNPGTSHVPESWSPDGQFLLFSATKGFVTSLWMLSLKDRVARPFGDVNASSLPTDAIFSPDGRWVAYQIGQAGVVEATTYVQPFPPTGNKYQIAAGGRPLWSHDSKRLFFVPSPGRLMAVTVLTTDPSFTVSSPVAVPRGFGPSVPASPRTFDILPDGRIVGVGTAGQTGGGQPQIEVVLNWFAELTSKVPKK
jgi:serine/threonine-protein kinase